MRSTLLLLILTGFFSAVFGNDTLRTHRFSPALPLNRWSSGTSWLPDSSLHAYYFHEPGNWKVYSQLNLFLRYNRQDIFHTGKRYSEKFDAPGFFLTRAETKVSSRSRISFTAMLSAEPFTVDGKGYPLLFQTGQTWKGVPLTDRQNPHDLLMELSAAYVFSPSNNTDLFIYTAYPGEPSVGPPSQMRRATAVGMPSCALGHHHQDATHISHGVVTGGFRFKKIQLEGSYFNGNQSDEDRWKPDPIDLNSYSYRISLNRRPNSAMQISQAWIHNPTGMSSGSGSKMIRSTFSILRASAMSSKVFLMSAFVIGVNSVNGVHSPSVLFETTYQYKRSAVFNRAELVKRTAAELKIPRSDEDLYAAQLSIGYQHRLFRISKIDVSLGLQGSVFAGEDPAVREYGEFPVSAEVFLRIFPQMQQPGKQPVSYYER